jgi:ABC-2 type transport system permease protein
MINYYLKIWLLMAKNSIYAWMSKKETVAIFLFGKMVRYIFYFGFLYFLVSKSNGILGFSANQALFFTATYTLVDTLGQFFFRSVYTFRQFVVTGDFDLVLTRPINALFRSVAGGPDPIDLITIPPIIAVVVYIGSLLNPTLIGVVYYLILVINALMISLSVHIFILGTGIITLTVDQLVIIFRDFSSMGRFPIDIYKEPLKSVLTFVVPVGIMFTIPAKAILGLVSPIGVLSSVVFGIALFILSLKYWQFALKKYTSASS